MKRYSALLLFIVLGVAACGDTVDTPGADAAVGADGALVVDASPGTPDAPPGTIDATPGTIDAMPGAIDGGGGTCGVVGTMCVDSSMCGSDPSISCHTGGSGGVCAPDRPGCGGFAGAMCGPTAPICMTLSGADFGPCLTAAEHDCVCAGAPGVFSDGCP